MLKDPAAGVGAAAQAPAADRAMDALRHVGARLTDERYVARAAASLAQQTRFDDTSAWSGPSLSYGDAGLALMCGALGPLIDDAWRSAAARLLSTGARGADRVSRNMDLHGGGLCGYAAVVEILGQDGDYARLRQQLADYVVPQLGAYLSTAAGSGGEPYDVINGMSGWNAYLSLRRGDEAARKCSRRIAASLSSGLLSAQGFDSMIIRPVLPEQRTAAPHGFIDCGMAHGAAGVTASLAVTILEGDAQPDGSTHQAVRLAADWLVAHHIDTPVGVAWPRVVLVGGNGQPNTPGPTASRSTWCYGTPGISRALALAGRALEDQALGRLAAEAMLDALRVGDFETLTTPNLCHGLAGVLMACLHFAWETGVDRFEAAARDLVEVILRHFDPQAPVGFRDVEVGGGPVDNAGFLSGAAGVAAALAAFVQDAAPAWSRLFLLN